MLKLWNKSRFMSSFLFWFVVILTINHVLLFFLVRFFLLKSPTEIFADMLMTVNEATYQIYQTEGRAGIKSLVAKSDRRGSTFEIIHNPPEQSPDRVWYPGPRSIRKIIQQSTDGKMDFHIFL